MTYETVARFTTPTAAGVEVDARAKRYVEEHQGSTYQEAISAVLANDRQLAQAYAQPATRRARMAATDPRSQPVAPVTGADEREIREWVLRALQDNMEGLLPGSLGALALEAARFKKEGMTAEESTARAMSLFPHHVAGAKMLIADLRRNENTPAAEAAQRSPSYVVHARAEKLMEKHSELDYRSAVGAVLSEDPALKSAYARS